jgi:hypothetical protein
MFDLMQVRLVQIDPLHMMVKTAASTRENQACRSSNHDLRNYDKIWVSWRMSKHNYLSAAGIALFL